MSYSRINFFYSININHLQTLFDIALCIWRRGSRYTFLLPRHTANCI